MQMAQQQTGIEKGQVQQNGHNRDLHSDLREDSRNSLRMMPVSQKAETIQKERNVNRGIHSEFTEHSQQSLGTLNIGRSRVQVTDQINTQHIPLTGGKLLSRITNISSFEGSNDGATDRGG